MTRESPRAPSLEDLLALVAALEAENAALKARLAELERRLGLNSSNSGKPPSSDGLTKPARARSLRDRSGKKPGGQKGHKGETLRQVAEPDVVVDHYPSACSGCGAGLDQDTSVGHSARQVFDLPDPRPLVVTEHRAHDAFRGTLIFDEADFRFSDERAEIVKILNNGNVSGLPVLRTMMNRQREFNPQAFQVFGPKIVATRGSYDDKGLESRFLTEEMGSRKLRSDIPINLPDSFKEEARELRNKLLLYRFHRRHEVKLDESLVDPKIEPRLNQILLPLMSVVADDKLRSELRSMALDAQLNLVADRGLLVEAQVLEILAELMAGSQRPVIPVADIATGLIERYGDEYDRPITNCWVGSILRKRLNIRTYKSYGVYVVPGQERPKIELLCTRFGINAATNSDVDQDRGRGDVGTS